MNEYRAMTKVSPDNDLCKRIGVTRQPTTQTTTRLPFYRRLSFWGVAFIVMVIAFVLPIALSLELKNEAALSTPDNHVNIDNPPASDNNTYLIYEKDLSYYLIDSIQAFEETHGIHAHLPTIECADGQYREIRLTSEGKTIGFIAELSVCSEKYFSLRVFTFTDRYKLNSMSFDDFTDETTRNDVVINYKYEIDEEYICSLEFHRDGYIYQAVVTCYDETPIEDILSDCFGL